MKKINLFIGIVAICISSILSGQNYDVNWGPAYKKDGRMLSIMYLAGATEKNYAEYNVFSRCY